MADDLPIVLSPKALCHVVLRTTPSSFSKMLSFYTTFLGGHVVYANDFIAFMTYDTEHHRIALIACATESDPATKAEQPPSEEIPPTPTKPISVPTGLHHIAFGYDSFLDFITAYIQRKAHNMFPTWCVNHGPTTSMYYTDPDGNQLETQVDNFATVQEATDYMGSKEFEQNPIGVDFDPEDLVRRVKGGEKWETLIKRGASGPRGLSDVTARVL